MGKALSLALAFAFSSGYTEATVGAQQARSRVAKTFRILLIGNSHIRRHNQAELITKVTKDAEVRIVADSHLKAGYTLRRHWEDNQVQRRIREGKYDVVVLQEHGRLPLVKKAEMFKYARMLDKVVKGSGAQTCLFMTSARRGEENRLKTIASVCDKLGDDLDATVAPIGLAWQGSLQQRPSLLLHEMDNLHATQPAAYLNICVLYAHLTGESPVGLPVVGLDTVSEGDARFLQNIALETVAEQKKVERDRDRAK